MCHNMPYKHEKSIKVNFLVLTIKKNLYLLNNYLYGELTNAKIRMTE